MNLISDLRVVSINTGSIAILFFRTIPSCYASYSYYNIHSLIFLFIRLSSNVLINNYIASY